MIYHMEDFFVLVILTVIVNVNDHHRNWIYRLAAGGLLVVCKRT